MSVEEVTYALDFGVRPQARRSGKAISPQVPTSEAAVGPVPRIARLMALAIRFEALVRDETMQDYAELARHGRVTRARVTQIMKLLDLAPDLQERILFLPPVKGLNERNLRSLVAQTDWGKQRTMFQKICKLQMHSAVCRRERDAYQPGVDVSSEVSRRAGESYPETGLL
jgi:hypothetical protein